MMSIAQELFKSAYADTQELFELACDHAIYEESVLVEGLEDFSSKMFFSDGSSLIFLVDSTESCVKIQPTTY